MESLGVICKQAISFNLYQTTKKCWLTRPFVVVFTVSSLHGQSMWTDVT
jgi:hypothetical protein